MRIVGIEVQEVSMLALYPQTLTKRGARVDERAVFTLCMPGIYGFLFLEHLSGFRLSSNLKNCSFFKSPFSLVPLFLSWRRPGSLLSLFWMEQVLCLPEI